MFSGGYRSTHGNKSIFGGQANKLDNARDDGRFDEANEADIKERFLARLKIGIPMVLYISKKGRGGAGGKRYIEMFTTNNARTLKVDSIQDEEKFRQLARASKRTNVADREALMIAAQERTKLRDLEQARGTVKITRSAHKNMELRTVDIKDLWQADVGYGDLNKHTIMDWPDGTALDLEGYDLDETLFVHKGLSLCLDDWTKNTSEYSDFWDSL